MKKITGLLILLFIFASCENKDFIEADKENSILKNEIQEQKIYIEQFKGEIERLKESINTKDIIITSLNEKIDNLKNVEDDLLYEVDEGQRKGIEKTNKNENLLFIIFISIVGFFLINNVIWFIVYKKRG